MKHFVLICFMTSTALTAFSQGRDTAFAVHKLFSQKRGNGQSLQSFSDSSASKAYRAQRVGSPLTKQEVRQNALFNTAFTILGTFKAGQYSVEEEADVIRRYNEGGSIPTHVRRKLRRKHFHRTTRDVLNAKY